MMSARVQAKIERDFPTEDQPAAQAALERLGADLSGWRLVSELDRVEHAALVLARGELDRLEDAVALARRDWRDLLVAAGDA